ncbi:hypothetical protein EN817_17480 [Mesorhizobium sp. M3A.F.Ca.ET.174.01.1.1]|uniref:hypothetical protein n=1 Tax=unclassified Mesorhizobium TaxID=325217 RepID=UPI001093BAD4|nr:MULTISPECIES: hypothetical protein [unclassified Mesorhizobium]TGS86693.1 hypothetical protein EN818_15335 [Mesorhizobium sp. M3A.F.Ca.ET.175.01.1.1]TGT25141.1 hypothetical protein EN817_17480 [Mesorhizobium sp. M3A.F.Ca.ET.174.01.1.1]
MINPSHNAFPEESNLIGLMVIGYSELDICLCFIGGLAVGEKWAVLDAIHTIENEGTRLDLVNRLVRHKMVERGFEAKFGEAIGALRFCKGLRNQYAHAQWVHHSGKLLFTNARDIPWKADGIIRWKSTNLELLKQQEAYFEYTRKCLMWLEAAFAWPERSLVWPEHMDQPPRQEADEWNGQSAPGC